MTISPSSVLTITQSPLRHPLCFLYGVFSKTLSVRMYLMQPFLSCISSPYTKATSIIQGLIPLCCILCKACFERRKPCITIFVSSLPSSFYHFFRATSDQSKKSHHHLHRFITSHLVAPNLLYARGMAYFSLGKDESAM